MDAARHNSQQQSVPDGPNDLLRQARVRLTEAAALLDRLCQLSSNGPESDQASDGSPLAYAGDAVPIGITRSAGRPPMIQKHDMQAYQLWQFAGMPQAKIAAKLNEEHGTMYSQGQVSKMIRRACVHMKATGMRRLIFTPGVKYVADNGGQHGAYWLLDAIASYQPEPVIRNNPRLREFQVWILTVDLETHTAVLRMCDGDDPKPLVEQKIEHTDFDLAAITIWAEDNGDGMTLLLPSEH